MKQIETAVNLARTAADLGKCGYIEHVKSYVPPAAGVNEKPPADC